MRRAALLAFILLALMACVPTTPRAMNTPEPTFPPLPPIDKPTIAIPSLTPCPTCVTCMPIPTPTPTPIATGEIIVVTWEDPSGCAAGYDGLTTPIVADVLLIYQGEASWMARTISLLTRPTGVAVYPFAASGVYGVQILHVYGNAERLYICDGTYQTALVEVGGMTLIAVRFGRWE
jgi:hypothetical protein